MRMVNMVPALANQSLLSGVKFAESGYVSVCNGSEVNIYDGHTATITVSDAVVMKGWRCLRTKLWRIPLISQVTDLNKHTILLNGPTGRESINYLYTVPTSAEVLDHIERFNTNHATGKKKSKTCTSSQTGPRGLIPPCSRRSPNQSNVAQEHLKRELPHLAADHCEKCKQALPRVRGNP